MKQMPTIQKYMSSMPHTIGAKIPIKTAQSMMREYGIRHLPVQEGGKLVGVLTDRDVKLASAFADAHQLTVDEVMSQDPYAVVPDAPLNRVLEEMAERKYGCAVIQQNNGKVVGIFTAIDAIKVLVDTLDAFYKPAPEKATHTHVS
jgi:acetoin utilization protein AcuB